MVCDGSKSFKIAAKCPISSHRVAGPIRSLVGRDREVSQMAIFPALSRRVWQQAGCGIVSWIVTVALRDTTLPLARNLDR